MLAEQSQRLRLTLGCACVTAPGVTNGEPKWEEGVEDCLASTGFYTIGALAARFAVSHRTLRFYEERGLLRPDRIGAVRMYSPRDVVRLQIILKAKRLGFSLSETFALMESQGSPDTIEAGAFTHHGVDKKVLESKLAFLLEERARIDRGISELESIIADQDRAEKLSCKKMTSDQ